MSLTHLLYRKPGPGHLCQGLGFYSRTLANILALQHLVAGPFFGSILKPNGDKRGIKNFHVKILRHGRSTDLGNTFSDGCLTLVCLSRNSS